MAQFIHSKWQPDQTLWYFLCTGRSKTSLPGCWFVTCCKTASCRGYSEHSNEPGRGEAIQMWKEDKSEEIVFIILIICFAEQWKSSFLAGKSCSIKTFLCLSTNIWEFAWPAGKMVPKWPAKGWEEWQRSAALSSSSWACLLGLSPGRNGGPGATSVF